MSIRTFISNFTAALGEVASEAYVRDMQKEVNMWQAEADWYASRGHYSKENECLLMVEKYSRLRDDPDYEHDYWA